MDFDEINVINVSLFECFHQFFQICDFRFEIYQNFLHSIQMVSYYYGSIYHILFLVLYFYYFILSHMEIGGELRTF